MNAVAINHSIPTLSRLLAVALARAAWNGINRTARITWRIIDALCLYVGAFTLMCWCYFCAGVLYAHEKLTSRVAMRRYKRWIVATYRYIDLKTTLFSEWGMNAIYLRGSLGEIGLDVADEHADGYVIVREFGDQRNVPFNVYIENRWLLRKGLTGRNIAELRTRVMDAGMNINRIVIGGQAMTSYAPLPEIQLPEVMTWKPAEELPDPRRYAPADILTRVA